MDGREQLRRYLEQRKESGERELVLDQLGVDEVLTLVGAARPATGKSSGAPARRGQSETPPSTPGAEHASADWRDVLRSTGAAPESGTREASREPIVSDTKAASSAGAPSEPSPASHHPLVAGISVGVSDRQLFGGSLANLESLEAVAGAVASCTRCPLYATATNPVPGQGNPNAALMIVGEAPGATEDEQGLAFVGAAGQLLTKILGAVDLKREDVFICNVLKHRPPGNRNPMPDEVTACSPYLARQFELIRPRAILALGTFAAQTLLQTKLSIGKLRSQVHRYHGVPLIVTYHPAALLRNPSWKRPTWEDVQLVRRILDSSVAQS
jgi:uracil-DNA glycosylase family 4